MRHVPLVCHLTALLLALSSSVVMATDVSGTITTTTWTKANSPYDVIGTITVAVGNTLTIEPGVDVLFDADVQFIVQGRLQAVGASNDSVRFLKGTAAEWGGIRISGGDTSTIAYARISDGNAENGHGGGVCVENSRLGLAHVVVSGNRTAWDGGGVYTHSSTVTLVNCTITGNSGSTGGGFSIEHSSTVALANCIINGNSADAGAGFYIYSSHGDACQLHHQRQFDFSGLRRDLRRRG